MSALAHVLEAEGLSTVALGLVRGQLERAAPPRALYVEFPLGRPLGRPADPAFQHWVLASALSLLDAETGPVLETFPEVIEDEADTPLSCALPPRLDEGEVAAVDEVAGLRPAYDRAVEAAGGRTLVGRVIGPDDVAGAVAAFAAVADGTPWKAAGIPADPVQTAMDVRAYYEEAALALTDHVPAARAAESWFYDVTETGKVMLSARKAMADAEPPFSAWYYLAPGTR